MHMDRKKMGWRNESGAEKGVNSICHFKEFGINS